MVPNEATEDRHGTYARLSDRGRRCGKMSHLAIRGGGPGRVECLFDDAMKMFGAAASNGFARSTLYDGLGDPQWRTLSPNCNLMLDSMKLDGLCRAHGCIGN